MRSRYDPGEIGVGGSSFPNSSFRGPNVDKCDARGPEDGHCAWSVDSSWLGNIPTANDFFMHGWRKEHTFFQPYITWVEDDGFSVVHGHPL